MKMTSSSTLAEKIYHSLVCEFPEALRSITEISCNQSKNFVISESKAFDFDVILNFKENERGEFQKEKTPDSIFVKGNTVYFVEFKEGSHKRDEIRQKIHEGIISLFQYSKTRGLADRNSFLELDIRYALIRRPSPRWGSTFLNTLESSADVFNLKNMEGLLVSNTRVRWLPGSICEMLRNISGGLVQDVQVLSA